MFFIFCAQKYCELKFPFCVMSGGRKPSGEERRAWQPLQGRNGRLPACVSSQKGHSALGSLQHFGGRASGLRGSCLPAPWSSHQALGCAVRAMLRKAASDLGGRRISVCPQLYHLLALGPDGSSLWTVLCLPCSLSYLQLLAQAVPAILFNLIF